MRYLKIFILSVICLACQNKKTQEIITTDHGIEWVESLKGVKAGAIMVPENHDDPNGKKIKLAYIIAKAQNDSSDAFPVIYFSGGPGGKSLEKEGLEGIDQFALNQDRDIIFFDQRGIGYSSGLPDMALESFKLLAMDADENSELELSKALLDKYKKECSEKGISLEYYTTHQSAKDVGLLFQHLGYKKYNLLGGSYGTRLGRVVQDFYPEYVHSVIHNSPAPMSGDFLLGRLDAYSLALGRIFDYCKSNSACQAEYPHLQSDYFQAIENLKNQPVKISLGDTSDFYINAQDGIYLIRRLLYQTNAREDAPKLIRALLSGEGEIISKVIQAEYQLTGGLNLSMLMAVERYEQFDLKNTPEVINKAYLEYPFLPVKLGFFDAFYQAGMDWHSAYLEPENRVFKNSDVPTLIFVNQFDPVTPPEYGHLFMNNLTNGQLLILDEGGHGGGNEDCRMEVMMAFMNNPESQLDISCLSIYDK